MKLKESLKAENFYDCSCYLPYGCWQITVMKIINAKCMSTRVGRKNFFFYFEVVKARKSCELKRQKKKKEKKKKKYQNWLISSGRAYALKFDKI